MKMDGKNRHKNECTTSILHADLLMILAERASEQAKRKKLKRWREGKKKKEKSLFQKERKEERDAKQQKKVRE